MTALEITDERLYCYCGCGEVTNANHLRARTLREQGRTFQSIADEMGFSKPYAMTLVKDNPPISVNGHRRPPNPRAVRRCLVCRNEFSATGEQDCCIDKTCSNAQWRAGLRRTSHRQKSDDAWFARHQAFDAWGHGELTRSERVLRARGFLGEARERQAVRAAAYAADRERRRRERRAQATYRDPFEHALSLDQPARGQRVGSARNPSLHDGYDWRLALGESEFSDPTLDAVLGRLDDEDHEIKAALDAWNRWANPRERPFFLTADRPTEIPNQANGLRHKMSGRHRGRHARSAAARGKRSNRSQPKASR